MTLACEDGNSKLVEVVTVVDVDDEKQLITELVVDVSKLKFKQDVDDKYRVVGNNLLQIWEMRFGHKAIFFRYCQLSTRVDQDFEFEVQARF